jgi:NAD(P)H-hydrate epimerase
MKILTAAQIRDWDEYTMQHEPITSIDLMERAAYCCVEWLEENNYFVHPFIVFCGKGNNGGDGLAIARMLAERNCTVTVYILEFGHMGTKDFQTNLERLHANHPVDIHFIQEDSNLHPLPAGSIIIDALFGSGLSRPLEGLTEKLVKHINKSGNEIISIDMPSGMASDQSSRGHTMVKAIHTLSFQCFKQALLMAENGEFTGDVHILDIGLKQEYLSTVDAAFELTDEALIRSIYRPRNRFAHKGNFGHALLIAGSYGKIGAAVLGAKACLRSGAGLLTCFVPGCGYEILQTAVPEAMVMTDINNSIITTLADDILKYDAVGIGPGIGTASETRKAIKTLFEVYKKPVLIDADALNGFATDKKIPDLPPCSLLTPHPKEFERLFGECKDDFERIEKALTNAKLLNCVIILKGHHTFIAMPSGKGYFNNTGNAGMATAGSGDVLTGILTGLLAQGCTPEESAILGVYLHGLAGDLASAKFSQEAMIAGDIINFIGEAFKNIEA